MKFVKVQRKIKASSRYIWSADPDRADKEEDDSLMDTTKKTAQKDRMVTLGDWATVTVGVWANATLSVWANATLSVWANATLGVWMIVTLVVWAFVTLGAWNFAAFWRFFPSILVLGRIAYFANVMPIEAKIWSETSLQVHPTVHLNK